MEQQTVSTTHPISGPPVTVTFMDHPRDEILVYGTFEFVQLTHELLRVGPDGDEIAHYEHATADWVICDTESEHRLKRFGDVVIGVATQGDEVATGAG